MLDCLAKSPAERPDVRRFAERLAACPGIAVWSAERADAWWAEHAGAIRERRQKAKPASSEVTKTLAVDLEARALARSGAARGVPA